MPPGSVSHYGWDQKGAGCGCSSGVLPGFLLAPFVLLRARRRRAPKRGAGRAFSIGALLAVVLGLSASARAEPAGERLKLAFPGLAENGLEAGTGPAISEYLQNKLGSLNYYRVMGTSDIQAVLGLERQKSLLGCSDSGSCMSELAGALDADRMLNATISKVGESFLFTLTLLDARTGNAIHRVATRLKGGTVDDALDSVDAGLRELIRADGAAQGAAKTWASQTGSALATIDTPAAGPVASGPAAENHGGWHAVVGARVEGDLAGLAAGSPAVVPALTFSVHTGYFGAAATVIIAPTPGARLEARLNPLPDTFVRPYVALGGTLFGGAFAPRLGAGAGLTYNHIHFFGDVAFEYFISGADAYQRLAALIGLGAGWEF